MAFKTFYCVLLLFCILFTVTKGSCLEYGHSCWGAHGKRSGNSQLYYHADLKPATEVDFADINAIKESPYDSSEDHLKTANDKMSQPPNIPKGGDGTNDENVAKVLKLKNILFKQLNKTGKHRMQEVSADNEAAQRTNVANSFADDRWRRLPIWNLRRYQLNHDNWLNNLEREQQQPRLVDDTEDYI